MVKEIMELSNVLGLSVIELVGVSTIVIGVGLAVWVFIIRKLKFLAESVNKITNKTPRNITQQALAIGPVYENLKKLNDKFNADRTGIILIHNGVHSENRLDLLKFSITDEALSGRAPSVISSFQDIPLSLYGNWISDIFSKKRISIEDIKEIENTMNGVYSSLRSNNVKSVFMFPLYPVGSDCPDGIGFMDFCHDNVILTDDEKDTICCAFGVVYGMKEHAKHSN
jgi:hypothetical protein